ncbi:hypothetical protein L1887_30118 [Cichorium endivia]|nr:hypothetical protein L1887_30118 [Cichorium endivia]
MEFFWGKTRRRKYVDGSNNTGRCGQIVGRRRQSERRFMERMLLPIRYSGRRLWAYELQKKYENVIENRIQLQPKDFHLTYVNGVRTKVDGGRLVREGMNGARRSEG